ncbi:hypothetical protein JXA88_01365 [Candidatus Fermentibacteria bacterium]|nr:hypothetical protein [Candidatus Fermentibacteria bacterium]
MRRFVSAILMTVLMAAAGSAQVNGVVTTVEGKEVLTVWGTHQERAHAHGYLLAPKVKEMFEDYIVGRVCYGQASVYNSLRSFYLSHYAVDAPYADEAQAMVDGIMASGLGLHSAVLNRDMDATDLLVCNAIVDLSQSYAGLATMGLGCSSLSSWGSSTESDSSLGGALVITRLMDWENHSTLAQNHLMIVSLPSEEDEQPWISLTFPAFIGGLSAVAESGVAAFLNVGNRCNYALGEPFQPILFSVRSGIERRDYDGDGVHTHNDILAAVDGRNRSSGTIIHTVEGFGSASSPVIIECNNERGVVTRDVTVDDDIAGENLAATNHFRVLYDPVYCNRYRAIADSMNASTAVSVERSWDVMVHAGAQSNNLHVIEYAPTLSLLKWATSAVGSPAYLHEPAAFTLDQLFEPPVAAETGIPARLRLVAAAPNPFATRTSVVFCLPAASQCRLAVYRLDGSMLSVLHDGQLDAGSHRIQWDDPGTGSGTFVLRLESVLGTAHTRVVRVN